YAGRMMDGSKFARESLGLRVEKQNVTDVIKKIEAQVNYNFNDHVMDNYSLRQVGMAEHHMTHEMVEAKSAMNVTRRTLNARMAVTHEWDKLQFITGVDSQNNKHGKGMYSATMPRMNSPVTTDMEFQSIGGFGELGYQLSEQN